MRDSFPDPSIANSMDFHSSAYQIKKLLRRRGLQDVRPMGGDPYGFMPKKLFDEWSKFSKRQSFLSKKDSGKEFERFVAQLICNWYCNPATFSNQVVDLSSDFDVLVEGAGESLFYFETKTSSKGEKYAGVPSIWNFMVREATLGADMSVFLYDTNRPLNSLVIPIFEILYFLAWYIKREIEKSSTIDMEPFIKDAISGSFQKIGKKLFKKREIYFLYWPLLVIAGGDKLKDNIGKAISAYYSSLKFLSPYERLSQMPKRTAFYGLPHWGDLPSEVKKNISEAKIRKWIEQHKKISHTT